MIDTSNAKHGLSKEDRYALEWFYGRNFNVFLEEQSEDRTRYVVSRYGVSGYFEVIPGGGNMPQAMEEFKEKWDARCELRDQRRMVYSAH